MNIEQNKILAALLVAGITAYGCGLVARGVVSSHTPEKPGFEIAAAENAEAGAAPAAAAAAEPITDLIATADPALGEKVAKVCASCHTFGAGEPHRIGPNLHGIVGKAKASLPGFAYSDGLKAAGGKWTVDDLNVFLWKPQKFAPGTKMTFAGLKKPEDRAALVKWLEGQK
jgi:cytochrome c